MPGQTVQMSTKPYLRIVQGNFVVKAEEGEKGARLRKWKTPNGDEGQTWENVFVEWSGKIERVEVKENDYGEICVIELDDAIITLNINSRYFTDFACKIQSADLSKIVTFHPYDFEVDGKKKSGISMSQDGVKLTNYFYDGEKNINGFPEPDPKKKSQRSYWKIYFVEVSDFLIESIKNLNIRKSEKEQKNNSVNIEELEKDFPTEGLPTGEAPALSSKDEIPTDLPF